MECTCCGPGPPHMGVLYVGVRHPAKQRFGVCTILILGTQMLPNLHQYLHDRMSQLLLKLLSTASHLALRLSLKKEKKMERVNKAY